MVLNRHPLHQNVTTKNVSGQELYALLMVSLSHVRKAKTAPGTVHLCVMRQAPKTISFVWNHDEKDMIFSTKCRTKEKSDDMF